MGGLRVASGWLMSILLALFVIASGWFTHILLTLFVLASGWLARFHLVLLVLPFLPMAGLCVASGGYTHAVSLALIFPFLDRSVCAAVGLKRTAPNGCMCFLIGSN